MELAATPFLSSSSCQPAGEQRATLCLLSLISPAPSQDRFDAKQFLNSCQNPPDPGIFSQSFRWQSLLLHFCAAFSAFSVTMLSKFWVALFSNVFQQLRTCPLAPLSLIKVKISQDISIARPVLCTHLRFVIKFSAICAVISSFYILFSFAGIKATWDLRGPPGKHLSSFKSLSTWAHLFGLS